MRLPVLFLAGLAACHRPSAPAPAAVSEAPRPPIVNRTLPAALDRIAFVREDGLWTIAADGGDLQRIVPPTCPRASEPTWAPDRRWIAFSAGLRPDSNLYPRNLFIARPDGSDLRQVTPLPHRGLALGEVARSPVRGRAVIEEDGMRRPVPGCRVSADDPERIPATDAEGEFRAYLPVGLGWVKISGEWEGRPVAAWRIVAVLGGRTTDLKDVVLSFDPDDVPGAPAWSSDGESLIYLLRHSPAAARSGAPRATLRRIRLDGSGDESIASFARSTILAGPVVRGMVAWCKSSEGTFLRCDLVSKTVRESPAGGIAAPDALAVSPDGRSVATLALDPGGLQKVVVDQAGSLRTVYAPQPGEPAPRAVDFSPDGTRLVLELHGADGRSSIYLLGLGGGRPTRLVENGASPVWNGR